MFVESERPLPIPWTAACHALEEALADGGLVSESRRAAEEGLVFVMAVGPRGGRHFGAHDVLVRIQSASSADRSMRVALRWEPLGTSAHLLPSLDGNLELTEAEAGSSSLSIVACYRPPLGIVGSTLDRAIMFRVANATMDALLREVADRIVQLDESDE